MRVDIRIAADRETIRAEIPGTNHQVVEPNRVAVSHDGRGLRLEAIGAGVERAPSTASRRPAYDPEAFEPEVSANVMNYLRLLLWSRHRSFPAGLLDRLEVRMTLAAYHRIPAQGRAAFEAALPRQRTTWLINKRPLG